MAKTRTSNEGFSAAEKAALKERAREVKADARANKKREEGEQSLLEKIAEMPEADRVMAERIHAIVTLHAPQLWPKTMYGMPAWALEGKVVCFFQGAAKFGTRYASFGFNDLAKLDDGNMWPTSFALAKMTDAEEARVTELVKRAVG